MGSSYRHRLALFALALLLSSAACRSQDDAEGEAPAAQKDEAEGGAKGELADRRIRVDPPAKGDALAPALAPHGDHVSMTWVERREEGPNRLRFSVLEGGGWRAPITVAKDEDLLANWADFPSARRHPDGWLLAHWMRRTTDQAHDYEILLSRSDDDGATWRALGRAHTAEVASEYGFLSMVPEAASMRLFWLDGREMAEDGPMTMRTARVSEDGVKDEALVDPHICECCQTDAVGAGDAALVVYRDRTEDEIRDIAAARAGGGAIERLGAIYDDGWEVPGCPVNGPAADAAGPAGGAKDAVVTAWFTAADNRPRVMAAFSDDGGRGFGAPIAVDDSVPLGRADVQWIAANEAVVTWIGGNEKEAMIRARRIRADGAAGEVVDLEETERSQASGFPRIARHESGLLLAFTEPGPPSSIRAEYVPLASIPAVGDAGEARADDPPDDGKDPDDRRARFSLTKGAPMPAYRVQNLAGEAETLEPTGRALLVNFWATWCAPCVKEMPVLDELQRVHGDDGLEVVGISVDDAGLEGEVKDMVETLGVTYTIFRDPENVARRELGATALPMNLLFDGEGRLVWWREGLVEADDPDLEAALAALLGD